jgi:hypothetical protein
MNIFPLLKIRGLVFQYFLRWQALLNLGWVKMCNKVDGSCSKFQLNVS